MRKKIAILFIYNDTGVTHYLSGIIKSLNSLEDSQKPHILVFYNEYTEHALRFIEYDYLEYIYYPHYNSRIKTYLSSKLRMKNLFIEFIIKKYNVDGIYPINDYPIKIKNYKGKLVSWIPDFQHKVLPHFFTRINNFLRESRFKSILKNADVLVLSSNQARNDLFQFYEKRPQKVALLPFVSMIKPIENLDLKTVLNKYNITQKYFLVANHFYKHKNHLVVFEAIKLLVESGVENFEVIFTGNLNDYRDSNFFKKFEVYTKDSRISKYINIIGLIPREEQILILQNSISIIQPSIFEGWNTSIEDAKTLNKFVICSNIPVHKEQLNNEGLYFNPDKPTELAEIMELFLNNQNNKMPIYDSVQTRIVTFAENFISIF